MKTSIRKMGNSQGVLIPKPLLSQTGIEVGVVEMAIENDTIVIHKPSKKARVGWAEASQEIATSGDTPLVWSEFTNADDEKLVW